MDRKHVEMFTDPTVDRVRQRRRPGHLWRRWMWFSSARVTSGRLSSCSPCCRPCPVDLLANALAVRERQCGPGAARRPPSDSRVAAPEDERPTARALALASIRDIADSAARADLLARMVGDLSHGLLAEALTAAADISDVACRAHALEPMLRVITETDRAAAIDALLHILQVCARAHDVVPCVGAIRHLIDLVPDDVLIACIDRFMTGSPIGSDCSAGSRAGFSRHGVTTCSRRVLAEIQTLTTDNAIEDEARSVASLIADQLLPTAFSMALRIRNRRGASARATRFWDMPRPRPRSPSCTPRAPTLQLALRICGRGPSSACDIAWHLVA